MEIGFGDSGKSVEGRDQFSHVPLPLSFHCLECRCEGWSSDSRHAPTANSEKRSHMWPKGNTETWRSDDLMKLPYLTRNALVQTSLLREN